VSQLHRRGQTSSSSVLNATAFLCKQQCKQ
jgi:hypothetical protein